MNTAINYSIQEKNKSNLFILGHF